MLTENIVINKKSYERGTRGVVIGFDNNSYPIVHLFNGDNITIKKHKYVHNIHCNICNEKRNCIMCKKIVKKQLPLELAWAISLNDSIGMTLDCVQCKFGKKDKYKHGEFYTTISRVKELNGLFITGGKINFDLITIHQVVKDFYNIINFTNL